MFRDQEEAFRSVRDGVKRVLERSSEAIAAAGRLRPHGLREWYLPNDANTSMASVLIEAGSIARFTRSLTQIRAANMPASRLAELSGVVSDLASALDSFLSMVADVEKDNRPLKYMKDGTVFGSLTNEQYYNFGEPIADIYRRIEAVRNSPALIGIVAYDPKSEERYEHSVSEVARRAAAIAESINEILYETKEQAAKVTEIAEEARVERESAAESWEEAKSNFDEMTSGAETAKQQLESVKDQVIATNQTITDTHSGLSKSAEEANEKIEEIDSFHTKVAAIQAELEDLRSRAASGHDLQAQYTTRVEELVTEAEAMVSGATTAGLAKAFDDERNRLSTEMGRAMLSFLVGIVFLFVTTILLAAYVFEIPIEIFGYNVGQAGATPERGDEITLAGVLSRTVILLAPFWLTLFSSRRYRNLFDLRQQYTHKYSMAFSVDGFKQQAPVYAEQMAAWVFHVVAEPPVTVKTSKGMGDNPLPDINAVVKAQLERFDVLTANKSERQE